VVVEERKKRERERPTDRRMRPAAVFNWEEGWGFVSLGAAPTINSWAAKYYHPRSLLVSSFSILSLPLLLFVSCERSQSFGGGAGDTRSVAIKPGFPCPLTRKSR